MSLFCSTHHTLTIESWNKNGVHVLDQDTEQVRLLLRDEDEVERFIASLRAAQQGVQSDGDYCTCPPSVPRYDVGDGWKCHWCKRPPPLTQTVGRLSHESR